MRVVITAETPDGAKAYARFHSLTDARESVRRAARRSGKPITLTVWQDIYAGDPYGLDVPTFRLISGPPLKREVIH